MVYRIEVGTSVVYRIEVGTGELSSVKVSRPTNQPTSDAGHHVRPKVARSATQWRYIGTH